MKRKDVAKVEIRETGEPGRFTAFLGGELIGEMQRDWSAPILTWLVWAIGEGGSAPLIGLFIGGNARQDALRRIHDYHRARIFLANCEVAPEGDHRL